jgi:monofunctional biosynthetic peptidoglycan transglycosylase
MVIIAEDSRFRTHHGLDWEEIKDAVRHHRERLRGASTITQQLAKNLYLSPSRSPFRKVKEAVTALRLELALPKDRILELYLNVAEWGPGVWGVGAASRTYFGVPPSRLDETQAAELAATLPFPRTANPALRSGRMLARRDLILARYHGVDVYIPPIDEPDTILAIPPIVVPIIPPLPDTVMDTIKVPLDSVRDTTTRRDTSRTGNN